MKLWWDRTSILVNQTTMIRGQNIWTDNENIYCSYSTAHYILNKELNTWETKTWNGLTSFYGSHIWTDGNNIYYSNSADQYILNKETNTWETKHWYGLSSNSPISGYYICADNKNIYFYSNVSDYGEYYRLLPSNKVYKRSNGEWVEVNNARIRSNGEWCMLNSGSNN